MADKNPREAKLKYFSPDGNYKTVVKKKYGEAPKVKETRTLKGVLKGAGKPSGGVAPLIEEPIIKAKKGGATGDKKWIQKAVNPKHKGFCTPETKKTCTPKRKALAHTLRKMSKNR